MKNLSPIQIILLAVFMLATVVAVLIFAGVLPGFKTQGPTGPASVITFWGTTPESLLREFVDDFKEQHQISVKYRAVPEENYASTVTNALAAGIGPDIWQINHDDLLSNIQKVQFTDTVVYPEQTFKERFLDEAIDILIWPEGFAGFPLSVDPLVLYWNRTMFRSAGIAETPKTWTQFLKSAETLTQIDSSGNITQSGAALGSFVNVRHAKDILSLLILQSGNPVVERRGGFLSVLDDPGGQALPATESSIRFYSEFADPRKTSYMWPPTAPDSRDAFAEERLGMYIGYASELDTIAEKNPHLDFDITEIPQISGTSNNLTYGRMAILVISKQLNPLKKNSVLSFMDFITNSASQESISRNLNHGPVSRQMLARLPASPVRSVVFSASIKSQGWFDPDPAATNAIFKEMLESVTSERKPIIISIQDANIKLQRLLDEINIQ